MAGGVSYKAVVPGKGSRVMNQDPDKPHFTVSGQDSRLTEGTGAAGRLGADQGSSDSSNQDFGLNLKVILCVSHVPIILIHYFLTFHFLDIFWNEKGKEESLDRYITQIRDNNVDCLLGELGVQKSGEGDHVSQYVLWEHVNLTIRMQHLLKKVITLHKSKKDNERPIRYEKDIIKYITGQTKEREKVQK